MYSIRELLQESKQALENSSDAPEIDAQRLMLYVLGQQDSAWLCTHGEEELSPGRTQKLRQLVAQRSNGLPLAYILGEADFYGRTFFVNNHVLIPRPETEQLVDAALAYLEQITNYQLPIPLTIADIGTGSGCIAITLLKEWELRMKNCELRVIATDISSAALAVARQNAQRHLPAAGPAKADGVAGQIEFIQGDMLEPLALRQAQGKPAVDLIVSNPPYLPSDELHRLAKDKAGSAPDTIGLLFEPRMALDGGPDGQKFIRKMKTAGIPVILETTGGSVQSSFSA